MASLRFACPKTNQQVATGVEADVQGLSASWKETLKVKCPHCGEVHEISVRDTYINSTLSDAAETLRRVV
jgi:RNase P subunit RPR2